MTEITRFISVNQQNIYKLFKIFLRPSVAYLPVLYPCANTVIRNT